MRSGILAISTAVTAAAAIAVAQAPHPESTPADSATADSVVVPRKPTIPIEPFFIDGIEDTFLTATLEVPEDRSQPDGRKIGLHIVIVPAIEKGTKRPPLFDIAGGPGIAATEDAAAYAGELKIHRQQRDVVLVDQRGTGQSNALHCPTLESLSPLDETDERAIVRECRDALAQTADLSKYTTVEAARDLDAVRDALAYDKIDVIGLSYGTQVVQVYMREFSENVHAAVMMGTVPLGEPVPLHHPRNAEALLQDLLDACDADPDCALAFPSLRREWGQLTDMFESRPFINASYADSTGVQNMQLHGGPFFETLRMLLVTTTMQRRLPFIIHAAAAGNFQPFLEIALANGDGSIASGMYLSVACAEGTMRIQPDEIDAVTSGTFCGRHRVDRQIAMCAEWGVPAAPDSNLRPVSSEVPTLLLCGAMDYVTPIAWAQEVSSRLVHSLVLVIDNLGHYPGGLENMDCYEGVIERFFKSGSVVGLDTACFGTMTPPDFVTE